MKKFFAESSLFEAQQKKTTPNQSLKAQQPIQLPTNDTLLSTATAKHSKTNNDRLNDQFPERHFWWSFQCLHLIFLVFFVLVVKLQKMSKNASVFQKAQHKHHQCTQNTLIVFPNSRFDLTNKPIRGYTGSKSKSKDIHP